MSAGLVQLSKWNKKRQYKDKLYIWERNILVEAEEGDWDVRC